MGENPFEKRFVVFVFLQKLTLNLIEATQGHMSPSLEQVTAKFEELYQGTEGVPGLKDLETVIPAKG